MAATLLMPVLLCGGCNRASEALGFSSAPTKPVPLEKADPATGSSPTTPASTTTPATSATGAAHRKVSTASKNSTRGAAAANGSAETNDEATVSSSATGTAVPETLASRSANASPATAPVVRGSRPPLTDDRSIYSKADVDVTPAKLLTPQTGGPTFRNVKPDVNTMELVVSKLGRVEQVKLITPVRRMTDMLLLSGAKTWRFTPALKNGQPVRYRTQFSWETMP